MEVINPPWGKRFTRRAFQSEVAPLILAVFSHWPNSSEVCERYGESRQSCLDQRSQGGHCPPRPFAETFHHEGKKSSLVINSFPKSQDGRSGSFRRQGYLTHGIFPLRVTGGEKAETANHCAQCSITGIRNAETLSPAQQTLPWGEESGQWAWLVPMRHPGT